MALSHSGIAQYVKRITTKPNLHMEGESSFQKVIESNTKSRRHTLKYTGEISDLLKYSLRIVTSKTTSQLSLETSSTGCLMESINA